MKTTWRRCGAAWLLVMALACVGSPLAVSGSEPGPASQLVRVAEVVDARAVRIEAHVAGEFEYTTYQPSENLFVVDLAGVTTASRGLGTGGARVLKSEIVSGYRVLQFRAGEREIVRLEILLRAPARARVERSSPNVLAAIIERGETPVSAMPSPRPEKSETPQVAKGNATRTPASARGTLLERVVLRQDAGEVKVLIEGNGALAGQVTRLSDPERLVVDFSGVRLRTLERNVVSSFEPVRGVRIGQFSRDVARVVIDLAGRTPYEASASTNGFLVSLKQGQAAVASATPIPVPEVRSETSEPAPALPVMGLERMSLPIALTQPLASLAHPVEPFPVPSSTENGKGKSENVAGSAATVTAAAEPARAPSRAADTPPAPSAAQQAQQKYTGEPIWVNLKDVDLKDFFRLIHEISGLNVVVDPNVRGNLTIVLDEVPWDQALEIVLKNNNLDKQIEGNVLRIATRDTLKKEAESQRDLVKAQREAVAPVVTTRTLKYAKANALVTTLKRFLSDRGEILADERSNTLIIRDIPAVIPPIDDLLGQLDRKSQQVEIEARVVSATRNFAREIGVQFGISTGTVDRRNIFGGLLGRSGFESPAERNPAILPTPPLVVSGGGTAIPLFTNLGATAPSSGLSYFHSSPNLALDFILSAAESRGVAKLLSKPKVVTQNNQKAEVKQGTRIPIQTVINNTITVTYIDAALKMEVTPQITADQTIFMELSVENTSADFARQVGGIPSLNTQQTQTTVLVSDGGTVVIGGVIVTQDRTTINQVPLFGSIPLIGHLFKRTAVSTETQELLFFVTPRIVPG